MMGEWGFGDAPTFGSSLDAHFF